LNDYKIKELYEQMELEIIDSMKRNLSRHLLEEEKTGFKYTQWQAEKLKELKRYQRENKTILNSYIKGLDKEISNHLKEEFKQSFNKQLISYTLLGINKENKNLSKTFFKINDRKVNSLIKVVNNDLNKANRAVLRMVNDEYRQIIHKSAFFVANGVKTEEQTTKMAIEEINEKKLTMNAIDKVSESFLNGGINCIEYADGKRVNIASYAQMAVRTANQRAQLMGEGEFRKSINQPFVIVSKHNHTCKLCQPWQGKVLIDDVYSGGTKEDGKYPLLSEAMKKSLFHPNCRHGLPTYYPELEGISYDEIEDNSHEDDHSRNKEKKLYYERQIKRFERLEKGSISPLNIQQFAERKEDWINKKEELLIDKKPINELSKDSKDALQYYVQGDGMYINDYLRNRNNPIERMGEMTDFDNQLIKDLDNATDNIISDKKLYRSVDAGAIFPNISQNEYEDLKEYLIHNSNQNLVVNSATKTLNGKLKEFTDKGFVSTTKDYNIAKEWGSFSGSDKPIVLELNIKDNVKGRNLDFLDLADNPQKEVLLKRNQHFEIKNISSKDGNIYIAANIYDKKYYYEDITKEMFENATPNSHKIKYLMEINIDGKLYNVDGKKIVLDYSKHEKEIAEFIKNKFGGEIFMYPRVNVPEDIRTPDYLWNGEKWDLKDIIKYNEKTIDNAIRKSKGQTENVILNIINSDYTDEILNNIMNRIYGSKDRQFLNKTIIIKDNKIYKILQRK